MCSYSCLKSSASLSFSLDVLPMSETALTQSRDPLTARMQVGWDLVQVVGPNTFSLFIASPHTY